MKKYNFRILRQIFGYLFLIVGIFLVFFQFYKDGFSLFLDFFSLKMSPGLEKSFSGFTSAMPTNVTTLKTFTKSLMNGLANDDAIERIFHPSLNYP